MIGRYSDSLSRASSIAKQFMTCQEVEKPQLFTDFLHELRVAAGSAHQIAIYRENTHLLEIRDQLEKIIEVGQTLPTFTGNQRGLWFGIKQSLDGLSDKGRKIADGVSMSRQAVLANLKWREHVARSLNDV